GGDGRPRAALCRGGRCDRASRSRFDPARSCRDPPAQQAAMSDAPGTALSQIAAGRNELLFLPLGGAGEIGMNLNLFGHAGQWLMVDLGVTFGDDLLPGIEVVMPDPQFIVERR